MVCLPFHHTPISISNRAVPNRTVPGRTSPGQTLYHRHSWTRTSNLRLRRPLLYPLSYVPLMLHIMLDPAELYPAVPNPALPSTMSASGLEPPTCELKARCSTFELRTQAISYSTAPCPTSPYLTQPYTHILPNRTILYYTAPSYTSPSIAPRHARLYHTTPGHATLQRA